MVAAAGARGELQPVAAWTLAVVALAGLVATALLNDRTQLYRQVGPLEPPEVLVHRAEDVLGLVQERRPARDHAYHFALDEVAQMRARLSAAEVLRARPGPLRFFYRRTPRGLVPHGGHFSRLWLAGYSDLGRVGREDPPLRDAGEAEVVLSPRGDLIELRRVPTPAPAGQPRWEPLLAATGIEATSLREVPPRERPAVPADTRRAWVARFPGESSAVRLEGASWAGQPVWLRVMGAWTEGAPAPEGEVPRQLARWVAVIGSLTLVVGVALAVRNLRRGRGDRRGAMRLALFCFLLTTAAQLLRVHHSSDPEQELYLLMSLVGQALFCAAAAWLFYVVLEPFCRRRWPRLLIAWSRLLAGRWRDPMVGRDALIGASAAALLGGAASLIWSRGRDVLSPSVPLSALSQASDAFYYFLHVAFVATINSVAILYLLVLARALLRRQAVAMAVVGGLLTLPFFAYSGGGSVAALFAVLAGGVTLLVLTRYGLLAHAVFAWVWISGGMVPLTLDPQAFYFGRSALVLAVLAVLTLLAFRSSLGGRSPWRLELLEA
jgi:serine/threonine-protein kinase